MAAFTRSGATSVAQTYAKEIDLAGSSASDVFTGPSIPEGAVVIAGGLTVTEAHAGTSTDMELDFGVTGGDVDVWVDGLDFDGASVGDIAVSGAQTVTAFSTADTADVLVAAQTGTTTAGKVIAWVIAVDAKDVPKAPGIAAVGS